MTADITPDIDPAAEPAADPAATPPTLRVRGPADLVQTIPYLLGFHPARSLVLVGLDGGRVIVTARLDLVDLAEPALLRRSVVAMCRGGARSFVGVVFDDDAVVEGGRATPLPWAGAALETSAAVEEAEAELNDVLLVSAGRMWSFICADERCCPPQGVRLSAGSEVAAAATYAGLVAMPDRASVDALLDPLPDLDRDRLIPGLDDAECELAAAQRRGEYGRFERGAKRALFAAARASDQAAATAATAATAPPAELAAESLARFGVALRQIPVRDAVWMAVDDRRIDGRTLWRQLARRLPAPFDAPPLFLFAWRTWREGDGALAGMAAERALASDPGYSAADLLLAALSQAVDPRALPRLRTR
jgi:hypothetical protein